MLHKWLTNFELNDPHLQLLIENLRYNIQFSRLEFQADLNKRNKLGFSEGVVFVLMAQIPSMRPKAEHHGFSRG